jgi:hypothetical protein
MTTLYCDGDTHNRPRAQEAEGPGEAVVLAIDPEGFLDVGDYSCDARLVPATFYDTVEGKWASMGENGVCPYCLAEHPDQYRVATEADLAALGKPV